MIKKIILVTAFSFFGHCSLIIAQDQATPVADTKPENQTVKLYKVTDKQGRVYYSDQPSKDAIEIKTDLVPSVEMKKSSVSLEDLVDRSRAETRSKTKKAAYSNLKFVNLENDGVVRNNGSTVTLTASISPALREGDTVNFFLDGKLMKAIDGLSATFNQVEYGPHKASFVIMSSDRLKVAESESIQIHLLHTVRKKAR